MDDNSLLGIVEGKPNKQKLFFFDADENYVKISHEISQLVLFLYLLNEHTDSIIREKFATPKLLQNLKEIDHQSKIFQVDTQRQKFNTVSNLDRLFGIFIVFQTVSEKDGNFWWSLDKYDDYIIVQRSRDKEAVKNRFKGITREGIEVITDELDGKGCIRELLKLLWIYLIIDVKYQRYLSRCESIIPLIMTKITKTRYEYKSDFKYSALSAEEKNPDLLDIINFLLNVSNWHPLIIAIYLGDIKLNDDIQQDGKFNINGIYSKFTLLNLAILFSKRKMIQHLLENVKVDPLTQDKRGRNALHMAAKFNRETEITNLLLNRKIPIDRCDAGGTTALNHAIMASNTKIVPCLLERGADPKRLDQSGRSPFHAATLHASDTKIIDLLLKEKGKVDINESDQFGVTALHNAAMASNITTARHLLKRGADINCRDKRARTPLLMVVFFAKTMEIINLFLTNEKVNLHCCDELGQNVVAYAQKNTYGLRQKIIDRLKETDGGIIKEYNLLKQVKSEINNWKFYWTSSNFSSFTPTLKKIKSILFFIPYADLKPGKGSEISEPSLIQYIVNEEFLRQMYLTESEMMSILSDIDQNSTITQVQIYQSSINAMSDLMGIPQFYIVFKTTSQTDGDYWCSLDNKLDYIVLQRSRDKNAVRNKLNGEERRIVKPIINNLVGKGSMKNFFAILWAHQVVQEKYKNKNSDSESFVTFVSEHITENGFEGNSTNKSGQDHVLMNLVHILSFGISKWHPLFLPICLGNAKLFDEIKETNEFDNFDNKLTPINLAIALPNKTEMVRHLLDNQNVDPTVRDGLGRNALETAAVHADNKEIIDLLLKHNKVQIDGCDAEGRTALHFAVASSNLVAARHLIEMGAKPAMFDHRGFSPLHLAAYHSDKTKMIDLLLQAQKKVQGDEGIDNVDDRTSVGITALHTAAIASNDITTEYLIKKGANPNRKDKFGRTPLHLAAFFAKDIKIINVLLNHKQVNISTLDDQGQNALTYAERNQNGLTNEISIRLKENDVKTTIYSNKTELVNITKIRFWVTNFNLAVLSICFIIWFLEKYVKDKSQWIKQNFNLLPLSMTLSMILLTSTLKLTTKPFPISSNKLLSMISMFRSKSKMRTLLFIPNADQPFLKSWLDYIYTSNKSNGFHEISQDILLRYLLNRDPADFIDELNSGGSSQSFDYKSLSHLKDLKKESHITNIEVYQCITGRILNVFEIYHTFIVFKTSDETEGEYWWSLDKRRKYIVMQRSRNKSAVVNRLRRKDRKNVKIISEREIKGKSTMSELLASLWAYNVIPEKYHVDKSSCQTFFQFIEKAFNQSFVDFESKSITMQNKQEATRKQKKLSFKPVSSFSSPLKNNILQLLIVLLNKFPKCKPLFAIVFLGDHVLLENLLRNNDVHLVDNGTTLLRLAILFSRTKMVEILLRNPRLNVTTRQNENSEMPWKDMSIFHTAAAFTNDTQIIDLLEKNGQVKNDPDAQGRTALHIAVMESNETTVSHLLKNKLIDPNASDINGISPLHLAAQYTDNTKIVDLILQAKKSNPNDRGVDECDSNGRTALHHAVNGMNVTTARHLMGKGANPNHRDFHGNTPLELAAKLAKDMEIVDLFLNYKAVYRELKEKGGDKVYNCAIQNKTAGFYNEIEHHLRKHGIFRKQNIAPTEDQTPSITGHIHDATNKQDGIKMFENIDSPAWLYDLFLAHGVLSFCRCRFKTLSDLQGRKEKYV